MLSFQVELHMRYIQLQRILQNKMNELEKLCIRERQLLEGKWKTHSLPARKKASHASEGDPPTPTQANYSYCRPTVSTEDVAKVQQKQAPPPPTLILAYQYLDPRYHYMLQPRKTSSGEYLLTFEQPRYRGDDHHFIVKTPCNPPPKQNKSNQTTKNKKSQDSCHGYAGQLCSPCIQTSNNADNTSLEAYDLASPCCDPHCVPSARRHSRSQKETRKRDSKTEETQTDSQPPRRSRPQSQTSSQGSQTTISAPRRYLQFGAGLVSQCSLHSCTSSELSGIAPTTAGESTASYTTSLSTDTLYWDGSCDASTSKQMGKPLVKRDSQRYEQQAHHMHEPIYVQYNTVKPKSWDNLATKAFGGYGFGYGYIDTSTKCSSVKARQPGGKTHSGNSQYVQVASSSFSGPSQYTPHAQRRYFHPTKSTESLLSVPKYSNEALSDSSLSCECLDASPTPDSSERRFFQSPRQSVVSPTDPNFGYYSVRTTRSDSQKSAVANSEATRL